jgi:hypothetical protein
MLRGFLRLRFVVCFDKRGVLRFAHYIDATRLFVVMYVHVECMSVCPPGGAVNASNLMTLHAPKHLRSLAG